MLNPATLQPVPCQFDETAFNNQVVFLDYYKRLRLLALSMFEWEGLPDTMSARFLEYCLYWFGRAAVVKDDTLGVINLKCTGSDTINIYGDCVSYHCFSTGYDKDFALDDMVLVRNNLEMIPTDTSIQLFAKRLYEAETTIETNIKAQKTPVLILCDDKQRLTMVNTYEQWQGNMPVIYGGKNFDPNSFTALRTDAPFVADKVQLYKRDVWSEALSFLGINNVAYEKKAQINNDETNVNNGMIQLCAEIMLMCRQEACKDMKEKYNINASVKMRSDWSEMINGEVYNGTTENS